MARLFITPREVDFISDITKEIIKDVIGQKIYYFSINELKTKVHDIYMESPEKIFDTPIALDAMVEYQSEVVKTSEFGSETMFDIEVWVHGRDLLDKQIELSEGDFFSFGDVFFEITKYVTTNNVYGEIEHTVGWHIFGKQARKTQFVSKLFGPTSEAYSDPDAVQETFVQQRGFPTDIRIGETGDVRDLQKKGVLERPISRPKEVSPKGSQGRKTSSGFYDDES